MLLKYYGWLNINDISILPCNCKDSVFTDPYHGHILSGDLRMKNRGKLRKLLPKGPKYREQIEKEY